MADVSVIRERGQLILVTGLLVAVAIVGLVLLLNTAIYTENLASRGADQSGREVVEYRATVVDGVGGLIDVENDQEHGDWDSVNDSVKLGIDQIDNRTARSYATGGTIVRIDQSASSLALHKGRLIRQTNSSREFTNKSGTGTDWTLATGVEDTRDVRMTVKRSSLVRTNASDAVAEGAFTVRAGGTAWRAMIYQNGSTDDISVAVHDGVAADQVCSLDAPTATVDLTRGTINGSDCPGLVFAEDVPPGYDIEYRDGGNATGTYDLTVNTTTTGALNDGRTNPTSPFWVPAVYSAMFDIHFQTPRLTYRTTVRVAPGEPE